MAKTQRTLDLDKEYEFKKPLHGTLPTTVRDALKWVEDHTEEDKEVPDIEWLIIAAVRRIITLHKDQKRHASGKLAERKYAPRVDNADRKPTKLVALVEQIHAMQPGKPKPEPKRPKVKPARERKPTDVQPTPPGDAGNPEIGAVL